MSIEKFFKEMRNHPVLFLGTGFSLRYLNVSYTWRELLEKIAIDIYGEKRLFLELLSDFSNEGKVNYKKLAEKLEFDFEKISKNHSDFEDVNDIFYENMDKELKISRFKIYISQILSDISEKSEKKSELADLIKARKNIGSIITTNYDQFIEHVFKFNPLVGNKILFSNPYGSVYKIHGCVTDYDSIVITESDYEKFDKKYELIKAQILSLFMHNPIIFIGYSLADENIISILKTIFSYVDVNSEEAEKIRNNFLLVEFDNGNMNTEVIEHDIQISEIGTIRINKIKTDNFSAIYQKISDLTLRVSAMEIRKVQSVWHKIVVGNGGVAVTITDDIDNLDNDDMVLAIGSKNNIRYDFRNLNDIVRDYFNIIDEENVELIKIINKHPILSNKNIFPIFAFSNICQEIDNVDRIKNLQKKKLNAHISSAKFNNYNQINSKYSSIMDISIDESLSNNKKYNLIFWNFYHDNLTFEEVKSYLMENLPNKSLNANAVTEVKRLLCLYDIKKYGGSLKSV